MTPRAFHRLLALAALSALLFTLPPARLSAAPPLQEAADEPWLIQFGSEGSDEATALALTPAGQIVVAGTTDGALGGDAAGETDSWVALYDLEGQQQWLKQFGGPQPDIVAAAAVGPDGQIFIAGLGGGGLFSDDAGEPGSYLLALDEEGNELWHFLAPGLRFVALTVDDAGVYVTGGKLEGMYTGGDFPEHPAVVYAFDVDGGLRWQTEIGDEGFWIGSVLAQGDGELFAAGLAIYLQAGRPKIALWVSLLNQEGVVTYEDEITLADPNYTPVPTGAAFTSTGLPMVVGSTADVTQSVVRNIGWQAQMVVQESGRSFWALREFRSGADVESVHGLAVKGPDRYWVSGLQAMFEADSQRIPAAEDVWLAEIGNLGAVIWITSFGTPATESVTAPVAGPDGTLYVAGSTEGDFGGLNAGAADVWILQVQFNDIGIPQLPSGLPASGAPPAMPQTPTAEYSSLAGTIVFAADPEAEAPVRASLTPKHQLYAVQADGSGLAQITRNGIVPWQTAAVAPDGARIALASLDASPVRLIDPSGRVLDEVKHPGKRAHPLEWSPSGDAVLFLVVEEQDDGGEDQDLWRLSVPGFDWTQITSDDDAKEWDASWSPDGSQVVTERDTELWLLDAGGGNPQQLGEQSVRFVAWSPDGKTIAYATLASPAQPEEWDMWAMDAGGANPRNLTDDPEWYEENPAWSPDSRYLIYNAAASIDGPSSIWILDMESGEKRVLVDQGDNVQPLWVPGVQPPAAGEASGQPGGEEARPATLEGADRLALQTAGFILDGSVWKIQADGSGLQRLTDPEQDGIVSAFTWAGDGSALAYIAQKDDLPPALHRLDLEDGSVETILDEVKEGKLAWWGEKIVLLSREFPPTEDASYVFKNELTILDLSENPPTQTSVRSDDWVMPPTEPGRHVYVTISPDGEWIYFYDGGVCGVAGMDGVTVELGPQRAGCGMFAHWTANPVALTSTRPGLRSESYTSRVHQFAPQTGETSIPFDAPAEYVHFSGDGQWAVIADPTLKILNVDDPAPRVLSAVRAADPRWSPWGDAILYRRTVYDPEIIGGAKMGPNWERAVAYDVITVDGRYQKLLLPNDVEDLAWRPLSEEEVHLFQPPTDADLAGLPVAPVAAGSEDAEDEAALAEQSDGDVEMGIVTADPLNFRSGPSTGADVLEQLSEGTEVAILQRSSNGEWLRVRLAGGLEGWVAAEFVAAGSEGNTARPIAAAEPTPPAAPTCPIRADAQLAARWSQAGLGCAAAPAAYVWAAWQSFERGAMLWREDTKQVYVLDAGGGWEATADTWNGTALTGRRGQPPAGLQAPERGIGYTWENDDSVFSRLGWATDQERGTCVLVQQFERGEILRSTGPGCGNGLYSHGQEPSFALQYLALLNAGTYSR